MKSESLPPSLSDCDFIVGLVLAADGTILECNKAFQNLMKVEESPVGRPLSIFLSPDQPALLERIKTGSPAPERATVRLAASDETAVSLDACLGGEPGKTLLFAPVRTPQEESLVAKMSLLNLEMARLAGELTKKNRELEEANGIITRLMNTDPLTGIANRRQFEDVAGKALAFSRRQGIPLSLIMADIDHFKQFNDRFGHAMGDEVLVAFAQMLSRSCRFEDTVCRYGGEEFLVLLPGTPLVPTRFIAERLRENTEKLAIPGLEEGVRASFGVAEFLADETLEELISRTDKALYKAKSRGRNSVEG